MTPRTKIIPTNKLRYPMHDNIESSLKKMNFLVLLITILL